MDHIEGGKIASGRVAPDGSMCANIVMSAVVDKLGKQHTKP